MFKQYLYTINKYIYHILIAIDQLFNAILGGYEDETLSSRAGRAYIMPNRKLFVPFIYHFINFITFNKDHCKESVELLRIEELNNRESFHWYN